jgi:O-antigen/teichoic acid export membrane protein
MSSLRRSALIAGTAQYVVYILAFVQVAIVSRILTPAEVGTYLLASSLVVLAAVPRSLGILEYIIAVEKLETAALQTCFSLLLVAAAVLTAAYVLSADLVAAFFDAQDLAGVLRVMAASFPFLAFGIIAQGKMRRDMQFGYLALIRIAGALAGFVVTLTMVLTGWGIAGLAWGFFTANVTTTLVVIWLAPGMIFFRPGVQGLGKILSFGGLTSVGTFLINIGDLGPQLLLGRATDTRTVGFFGRGQTLVTFLRQGTEAAMGPVIQPWFAQLSRTDNSDLAQSFIRLMGIVCVVTWPAFVFLYFQADFLVPFLLGDAWSASIPIAKALAVGGMFSPYATYGASVQAALGKVGRRLSFVGIAQVIRFTCLALAIPYGLLAFAWTMTASHILAFGLALIFLQKDIGLAPARLLISLHPSALLGVLIGLANALCIWGIFGGQTPTLMSFATASLLSGIVWFGGLIVLKHELLTHMGKIMGGVMRSRSS